MNLSAEISIHADVYQPFRNIVSHITPYTTWILKISDDRSSDIDLSGVTEIKMRLEGSAVDGENKYKYKHKSKPHTQNLRKGIVI